MPSSLADASGGTYRFRHISSRVKNYRKFAGTARTAAQSSNAGARSHERMVTVLTRYRLKGRTTRRKEMSCPLEAVWGEVTSQKLRAEV